MSNYVYDVKVIIINSLDVLLDVTTCLYIFVENIDYSKFVLNKKDISQNYHKSSNYY